jgi:S-DNA-T family DNA segregation ATPase FtsK/SpoIIIE
MSQSKKSTRNSKLAQEVWGIVCVFFGALLLIALVSYNHADPTIFTRGIRTAQNWGGKVGANIAELFMQVSGIASYIVVGLCFTTAMRLFKGIKATELAASLFWNLLSLIACGTFLALAFGTIRYGGANISSGGLIGGWIAKLLLINLNTAGALLFTSCTLLIALVFSTPLSAGKLFESLARGLKVAGLALAAAALKLTRLTKSGVIDTIRAANAKRKTEKMIEKNIGTLKKPKVTHSVIETEDQEEMELPTKLEVVARTATPKPAKKEKPTPKPQAPIEPGKWVIPSLDYLVEPPATKSELDRDKLVENSKILETKLTDFGIDGQVVAVRPGPVITMYEFKPGPGVKISQIAALADDLSLALSAQSVRIVAPIPGKSVVGIEIPNEDRETVFLREILSTEEFQGMNNGIPIAIGKDISGTPIVSDISRMPHLLIAGASGKGKSVFINSLICSLLYKFTPNDLRLIMVDPKQVELNLYEDIPHLLLPVVDDMKKASTALKWAVNEMERRYKLMARCGIRNLAGYNQKLEKEGETKMRELLCPKDENGMPTSESLSHLFEFDGKGVPRVERMPQILVIIDEFADLMMVAPKDIETSVARLGQKARAAGIHLIIATQRPSVDVITGLIKANLPSRISFQVASKIDSRTILDGMGAEKLLGQGDMLFIPPGSSRLTRIHGAFLNEDEIGRICEHWRAQGAPVYREEILIEADETSMEEADGAGDELYSHAINVAKELGTISTSMLQRRLKVGYNRAARMMDAMEIQGIVGPAEGSKPREVIY